MHNTGNHNGEGLFALKTTVLDTKYTGMKKSVDIFQHRVEIHLELPFNKVLEGFGNQNSATGAF